MITNKNKIIILFIFFANITLAQEFEYPRFKEYPVITKEQMYEDFDEFIKIVEDCAVQLPFKKLVTGFDNLAEIKKLRKNIDTISETSYFYSLVQDAIYLIMDDQTGYNCFATNFDAKYDNFTV